MSERSSRHYNKTEVDSPRRTARALFVAAAALGIMVAQPGHATSNLPQPPTIERLTGADTKSCIEYDNCATDLLIPYLGPDGKTIYLGGDTFSDGPDPDQAHDWRGPTGMYSTNFPNRDTPIEFDGAMGLDGSGMAPELMHNGHFDGFEATVIPSGAIYDPATGLHYMSYQSVKSWDVRGANWSTNYSGIAVSYDGGRTFDREAGIRWQNTDENDSPFQMMSMQTDGDYTYMLSNRAGRQAGPMVLQRVRTSDILNQSAYECWSGSGWGNECTSLLPEDTPRGEPELKKLRDGVWVMAYLKPEIGQIVTRSALSPEGPWSDEKVQVTSGRIPNLYGGFIHPDSTSNNLVMMVSSWVKNKLGKTTRYGVSQVTGTAPTPPRGNRD